MADQGAGRNAGQAAGNNRFVKFSHGSAQRIAKVVRTVEAGDRNQPGITFDHPMPASGKVFRIGTFSGSWSIDSSKTVTFKYQTATPNTASATNLFFDIPSDGTKNCAIAKDGTAWFLVQWQWAVVTCSTATSA